MSETPHLTPTVICLGSNTPQRSSNIKNAISALAQLCDIIESTPPYETPDDSGIGKPYLNVVISCRPKIPLKRFRNSLKLIEKQLGRNASSKAKGIMPLDLDIVIWLGKIIDSYEYSRPYFKKGLEYLSTAKQDHQSSLADGNRDARY